MLPSSLPPPPASRGGTETSGRSHSAQPIGTPRGTSQAAQHTPDPAPAALQPASEPYMSFGEHSGKPMSAVPTDYLAWAFTKASRIADEERNQIGHELARRKWPSVGRAPRPTGNGKVHTASADQPASRTDADRPHAAGPDDQTSTPASSPPALLPLPQPLAAAPLPPGQGGQSMLSVQDVAGVLGVSVRSVWRMRHDGRIPPPRHLGPQTLRWPRSEIDRVILEGFATPGVGDHAPSAGSASPMPTDDNKRQPMTTSDNR
jgi:predicted DNA-binding transcriptional regulator AlpA